MPRIQWEGLPPALRNHLFDRLRDRQIRAEDLWRLKEWRESEPDAPDGPWVKVHHHGRNAIRRQSAILT